MGEPKSLGLESTLQRTNKKMRLWPCRCVLTAAAQSIAKNGQKMTQKWPFLTLKNAFFYFFVEDSHRARKVQIANVRSRIYEGLILTSYSRFFDIQKIRLIFYLLLHKMAIFGKNFKFCSR